MKCDNINCNNNTELRARGGAYKKYCCNACRISCVTIKAAQTKINNRDPSWYGTGTCHNTACGKITLLRKDGKYFRYCSDECKKKGVFSAVRHTNVLRYGVENAAKSDTIKTKIKNTFEEKYGGHPMLDESIKNKVIGTNLERYGVGCSLSSPIIQEKIHKTTIERYGVKNASQKHIDKNSLLILDSKDEMEKLFLQHSMTQISKLLNVNLRTVKLRLVSHGIYSVRNSSFESHLINFLNNLDINCVSNTRSVISPLELDIYIPDLNLAIECNGDYWHSELQGKDKNYHLNKTILCKEKGIDLLHIYEHQWESNNDIVKSIILSKLGKLDKIYARKCSIRQLTNKDERLFLENNHIQGHINSNQCYGLYYNDELVSLMSFGKSRYGKGKTELLRFANKTGITVIGGASKLFKHFVNNNNIVQIISYSHRDKFSGNLYKKLGFEHSHISSPSYYYTKDYVVFENRMKYQKHKLGKMLDTFNADLTEWENMVNNGYDRLWDCGNDVWIWNR